MELDQSFPQSVESTGGFALAEFITEPGKILRPAALTVGIGEANIGQSRSFLFGNMLGQNASGAHTDIG